MRSLPGIDYRFENPELLQRALTHRSHGARHNERLEFLGDALLNFVVAELLYRLHPDAPEGDLSRLRARIVRGATLARIAADLGLGDRLRLGEGELKSGGFRRPTVLADSLEAVIGAIHLDGGFEAARRVVAQLCEDRIRALPPAEQLKDAKTRLQERLQARGWPLPEYRLVATSGADHKKRFTVVCRIAGLERDFAAEDTSRRQAEKAAAGAALAFLDARDD